MKAIHSKTSYFLCLQRHLIYNALVGSIEYINNKQFRYIYRQTFEGCIQIIFEAKNNR